MTKDFFTPASQTSEIIETGRATGYGVAHHGTTIRCTMAWWRHHYMVSRNAHSVRPAAALVSLRGLWAAPGCTCRCTIYNPSRRAPPTRRPSGPRQSTERVSPGNRNKNHRKTRPRSISGPEIEMLGHNEAFSPCFQEQI